MLVLRERFLDFALVDLVPVGLLPVDLTNDASIQLC